MRLFSRSVVFPAGAAFAALGGAGLAFLAAPHESAEVLASLTPEVVYFVPDVSDAVALTIDDSPDPEGTPRILEVLREHSARATFFVIGERVAGNEALLERMVGEGHELGNHDYRERMSALVDAQELARDVDATHSLLSRFSPVRWFRPGSGVFSPELLEIADGHDYRVALGDVFPVDGNVGSSEFHRWYILRHVEPGSIIILHDAEGRGARTAETLAQVLPVLRERGLAVVTLSELERRR